MKISERTVKRVGEITSSGEHSRSCPTMQERRLPWLSFEWTTAWLSGPRQNRHAPCAAEGPRLGSNLVKQRQGLSSPCVGRIRLNLPTPQGCTTDHRTGRPQALICRPHIRERDFIPPRKWESQPFSDFSRPFCSGTALGRYPSLAQAWATRCRTS